MIACLVMLAAHALFVSAWSVLASAWSAWSVLKIWFVAIVLVPIALCLILGPNDNDDDWLAGGD